MAQKWSSSINKGVENCVVGRDRVFQSTEAAGFLVVQLKHHRTAVPGHHAQQPILVQDGRGDNLGLVPSRLVRHLPIDLAGGRIERRDVVGGPKQ